MQLRDWQQQLQQVILQDTDVQDTDMQSEPTLTQLPLLQTGAVREQRLQIYQNAYQARLTEALRSNFPALHQLLGDADFALAARGFIAAHPPVTASIRWFGDQFSMWLQHQQPFCDCPAIAELARFEWALRHTIDGADGERISMEFMQTQAPEQWHQLYFDLHPALALLHLQWNITEVWQALTQEQVPPAPQPQPCHWLVYRQLDLVSAWRSAEPLEVDLLQKIQQGHSFGDLCEFLYEQTQDPDLAVNQAVIFLKSWIEQGLLVQALPQPDLPATHGV